MYNQTMSQKEAVEYWLSSANEDWEISQLLFGNKKYSQSLFFLQLALEKLIKAIHVAKKDEFPLYVHNLVLLTQKADISFSKETLEDLKEISSFNITARYDSYKRDFYKKATSEFTSEWLEKGSAVRSELLKMLKQT